MKLALLNTLALLMLMACSRGASHIPPLHQIPGAAVGATIENSLYNSRREKVTASIEVDLDVLLSEADLGGGRTFTEVCKVAKVRSRKCDELANQVAQDGHLYKVGTIEERIEKLTVAFMVYGD